MSAREDIELESPPQPQCLGARATEEEPDEIPPQPLPGDVRTREQLALFPPEYLNLSPAPPGTEVDVVLLADERRPLRHVDAHSNAYALNPLQYSVCLILILELLERFSFYGLYMTQTNYLMGSYEEEWNADLTSMDATSLISLSTAVAYTVPFAGGMLADAYLGDYKTILAGMATFYLPGLFLIASSTAPNWWLGTEAFNVATYKLALLLLWPVKTDTVKAVVNIFGARQYHPVLQRSMVESFYVQFYMVINVGAVAGCIIVPIVAQKSGITVAYAIPFVLLLVALLFFVAGSRRYVKVAPQGRGAPPSATEGGLAEDEERVVRDEDKLDFRDVARICALIIPFNIVYNQCPTTFTVQGAVMEPFLGFIEAPSLDILDSVSVLVSGYIVSSYFYPFLARNNIKLATGYKFALGSAIGACAILWSLLLETMIHNEYVRSRGKVNVIWQAPSYIVIGALPIIGPPTVPKDAAGYEVPASEAH